MTAPAPVTVSKSEFDALATSVKEIADLAAKNAKENQDQLATLVKEAIAAHPGITAPRKVQFEQGAKVFGPESVAKDITDGMPAEAQKAMDNVFILSKVLGRNPRSLKSWNRFNSVAGDYVKALEAATSGQGNDWVPTDFSNQLYELVRLSGKVVPLFPAFDMPSSPYKLPVQIGRLTSFKHAEQTGDTGQTKIPVGDTANITGNAVFTAQGHAVRVLTSKDLEEDSIVPMLPFLQNEIVKTLAEGREDAILNGSTTATHEDADVTSASDRRKLWNGLRILALNNSYKVDIGTFNTANLRLIRKKMGRFGVTPGDLAWIVDVSAYIQMLGLAEVITMEKYGPDATIVKGELAKFDGIPVIVSEWVRSGLNASGVQDGSTTTKTTVTLVNRNSFAFGTRRGVNIQLLKELYAESDQDAMVVRERVDFEPIYPIASNTIVGSGYNLTE